LRMAVDAGNGNVPSVERKGRFGAMETTFGTPLGLLHAAHPVTAEALRVRELPLMHVFVLMALHALDGRGEAFELPRFFATMARPARRERMLAGQLELRLRVMGEDAIRFPPHGVVAAATRGELLDEAILVLVVARVASHVLARALGLLGDLRFVARV